jgi:phage recombination protein Bet
MMSDLPATTAPATPATYDREKLQLIRDMCAKGATDNEFLVMMELANRYQLDPFARQIWLVKYGDSPAQIFCGRDGYLAIAHRSGVFDGMEAGADKDAEGQLYGWCRVWRKDMSHPFEVRVYASEYSTGKNLWRDKPRTMIQKVAEAQCAPQSVQHLRPLFSRGDRHRRPTGAALRLRGAARDPDGLRGLRIPVPEEIREKTKPHTDRVLCIEHFSEWWNAQKEATE